jgi:hypothetical protein
MTNQEFLRNVDIDVKNYFFYLELIFVHDIFFLFSVLRSGSCKMFFKWIDWGELQIVFFYKYEVKVFRITLNFNFVFT